MIHEYAGDDDDAERRDGGGNNEMPHIVGQGEGKSDCEGEGGDKGATAAGEKTDEIAASGDAASRNDGHENAGDEDEDTHAGPKAGDNIHRRR